MRIKQTVRKLVRKYGTSDPFDLASRLNIIVINEYLADIYGYYNSYKRSRFIHVNDGLDDAKQRFTCAHELGHAMLHPKVNTPFLRQHTLVSVDRIEREANQFAAELLIPDELLLEHTLDSASAICGVPLEVAHLKTPPARKGFWWDEQSFISF
ncbi:hypothetical protein Back11_11950 [Paenibacillus baekrokdamisoli]|uniref:IrrE N-terminal-like domain-containing protein n=1 Tax=Paenibacillus baekrokdamisoli TaxID=1712516 RepID=A0A3G9ILY9_9BACL|nr:ImmA/IrrE family metallo-endopeptidase [Paenibacillus baekrokdamisoli]MBB3070500.1 Zn-dependent peptidase ImmA (M78 family) [Paenibacillus baekrokdamisoli]BBH19850.1 hypothetical protein Back11_11950 [Paenibacillus baekrokdamisoli]